MALTEAERLLYNALSVLNQLPNRAVAIPRPGLKKTYDLATAIEKYFRTAHPTVGLTELIAAAQQEIPCPSEPR